MNSIPGPIQMLMEIYTGEYEGFELNDTTNLKIAAAQLYAAYMSWSDSKGFRAWD